MAFATGRGDRQASIMVQYLGPPTDGPQARTRARRCSIPQGSKRTEDGGAEAPPQIN
jgi:hypothetical protein